MESDGDTNSSLFKDLTKKDEDKLITAVRRYEIRLHNRLMSRRENFRLFNSFEQLLHDLKERGLEDYDDDDERHFFGSNWYPGVSWRFLCWVFNSTEKDPNLTGSLLLELSETTPSERHPPDWHWMNQYSEKSIERYSYIKELVFNHIEIWQDISKDFEEDEELQELYREKNKHLIPTTHASNASGTYTCKSCKAYMSYREPLICNSCLHKGGSGKDPDLNARNNHNYGDFGIDFDKY